MPPKSNNNKAQTKITKPSLSDSESSETSTSASKNVKPTTLKKNVPVKKVDDDSSEEESSSEEEKVVVRVASSKATTKAVPKKKIESSSEEETSSEEESSESSSESEEETPKKPPSKNVAPTKKRDSSSEEESSEEESSEEEATTNVARGKGKGKAVAAKQTKGKENLDDILGEFVNEGGDQKSTKAQLKRWKKKQEPAIGTSATSTTSAPLENVTEKLSATTISGEGENEGGDDKKLSKAQLARLRKKEKEAKEKEAKEKEAKEGVQPQKVQAPEKSKATRALAQRIKKEREEMERKKKEEEDRIAAEEAAEAARIAEEKRLKDEEEKRKADKKAKRAADLKAGLVMSNAEKKKAKAAKDAVEAMKAAGYVVGPVGGEVSEAAKKKRPVYGKKPKKGDAASKKEEADDENNTNDAHKSTSKSHDKALKSDAKSSSVLAAEDDERKKEEEHAKLDAISEEEPDWEAMMVSSDQGENAATPASWDVDSEEEREQEAARKAEHNKRKETRVQNVDKLKKEYNDRKQARLSRIEARKAKQKQEKLDKQLQAEKERSGETQEATSGDKNEDAANKRKDMRSPICCILGHVDTGKTKLLDKIRHTNVQDMEAGGITQQIGATYFPTETIKLQTAELQEYIHKELEIKVPGLLVIDTPGHESFSNLRARGSGLCDIAILVVDIMAGLEKQTLESIQLLKSKKTPFVIALNKCDRMYGWKAIPNCPFKKTLDSQTIDAQQEFDRRLRATIVLFAEQGLNACLYWENKDFKRNISVIPTSAITGEGVPDLLMLLVQLCQKMMNERLMYIAELQCTVLEVKVIEGHGTTIDVILANGVLHEGDTIVICGMQGPIVTRIRALLTPPPLRELRVKSEYVHNKMVKAAAGLKISAPNLEHAVPGSQLLVCGPRDDLEALKDEVMQDLASILARVDRSGIGVSVQASTLGSLEALLTFLGESKIPVSGIAIGPVHKKDVMKAATMLERKREFAIILAFDVAVSNEAQQWAREMGVQIFTANIIYHLFDMCTNYMADIRSRSIEAAATTIVFPCVLEVLPDCVFRDRAPLVLGVRVLRGLLKLGTPLCVPTKEQLMLGKITSIQKNHVEVKDSKQGEEVCIKIESSNHDQKIMFGRHFDFADHLVSKLSRTSIDHLKLHFKDELTEEDWKLVVHLKKVFGII